VGGENCRKTVGLSAIWGIPNFSKIDGPVVAKGIRVLLTTYSHCTSNNFIQFTYWSGYWSKDRSVIKLPSTIQNVVRLNSGQSLVKYEMSIFCQRLNEITKFGSYNLKYIYIYTWHWCSFYDWQLSNGLSVDYWPMSRYFYAYYFWNK